MGSGGGAGVVARGVARAAAAGRDWEQPGGAGLYALGTLPWVLGQGCPAQPALLPRNPEVGRGQADCRPGPKGWPEQAWQPLPKLVSGCPLMAGFGAGVAAG